MNKVFTVVLILFLCIMVIVLNIISAYAKAVTTYDSDVDIIVKPFVKANWNFYGVVPMSNDLGGIGVAYYNKFLNPAWDKNKKVLLEDKRAMVGCLNWGLGEVMHTLKYPNSVSCDNKLNTTIRFKTIEKPYIKNGEFIFDLSFPVERSFLSPDLYNWDIMATNPDYEYAKTLSLDVYIASRDEVARLLYDISTANKSRFCFNMPDKDDTNELYTKTNSYDAPNVLREYFFYKNAVHSGLRMLYYPKIFTNFGIPSKALNQMINPNLDAGYPVLLDMVNDKINPVTHIVVIDGYGYYPKDSDKQRILHHVIFGFGGEVLLGDGWYDLSDLKTYKIEGSFTNAIGIVYNIFPEDSGILIGGRVLNVSGDVLSGDQTKNLSIRAVSKYSQISPIVVNVRENGTFTILEDFSTWDIIDLQLIDSSSVGSIYTNKNTVRNQMDDLQPGVIGWHRTNKYCNHWPIDFIYPENIRNVEGVEEGFLQVLQSGEGWDNDGTAVNCSFISKFGNALNTSWNPENTDVLFVESFPYIDYVFMYPWINELVNKAEIVAQNGGTVYITGHSWFFAKTLANRAGMSLNFFGENEPRYWYQSHVLLDLNEDLKNATGLNQAIAVFTPDVHAPVINPLGTGNGIKNLAAGEIYVQTGTPLNPMVEIRRYPMAIEFPLGEGKVVYSSFTVEPNISAAAMPEIKKVVHALVSEPLKMAKNKQEAREILKELPFLTMNDINLKKMVSKALMNALSQDFEVECSSPGNVTFVLKVTDLTLGLDVPSEETLHTLDVSLYTPDDELFGRQRVNGTRVSFPVSADSSQTPQDYIGVWRMRVNEAIGFTPHQALVAMCIEGLHQLDNGDPGYDPYAFMAYLNIIEGTNGADYLVGASNPASIDFFVGKNGADTYLGGAYDNIYTWEMGGGNKTVVNNGTKTEPSGILLIDEGPDLMHLGMDRAGDNLVITLKDEDEQALGSVTIQGWFTSPGNKLELIHFINHFEMTAEEIETWVDYGGWDDPELPAVTSVAVSPSSVSVHKGLTQTFYATVNGTNNPPQTVTWTVEGGIPGTSITQGGELSVAASETAASLTVRATSTADASKSGTAAVTVTLESNNYATINGTEIGLSGNADGTGWNWNAAAKTLTLTGVNDDLGDIVFVTDDSIAINVTDNITANCIVNTGNGKLTITCAFGMTLTLNSDTSPAISANGDIEINGGSVYAVTTADNASAIESMSGSVTISGAANVTAETINGYGAAISAATDINISTSGEVKGYADTGYSLMASVVNITNGVTELFFDINGGGGAYNVANPSFSGINTKAYANGLQLYPYVAVTLKVSFQARATPSAANIENIMLKWISNNAIIAEETVKAGQNGETEASIPMINTELTLWVKGERTLAASQYVGTVNNGDVINVGTLLGGEGNGDNKIDLNDFNLFLSNYGRLSNSPVFNRFADFNNDGVVDLNDFNIFLNNYGKIGAQLPGGYSPSVMSAVPNNEESEEKSINKTDSNSGCNVGMIGFAMLITSAFWLFRKN
ncbi:MAG: C10 family peptidase [Synergistaceae bacterium]|nr:C10 family peptidase [Synergistaceae bacterium]